MKKIISLVLCGLLTIGCFIGCDKKEDITSTVDTKIKVYSDTLINSYMEDDGDTLAHIFEKVYGDSEIEYVNVDINKETATVTVIVKGKNFSSILNRGYNIAKQNLSSDLFTPVETLLNNGYWEAYDKEEPEERKGVLTLTKINETWTLDKKCEDEFLYLIAGSMD